MNYLEHVPGRHPAYYFPDWHKGPDCKVSLLVHPTSVWIWCDLCRVAAQLDTIAIKILVEGSGEVA